MKYLLVLFTVVALASCGAKPTEKPSETNTGNTTTNSEINKELEKISSSTGNTEESKIVKIDASYDNPKTNVDMAVAYELDSEGKISKMDITATTFDLSSFEEKVEKEAIGKTLEEASKIFVSGESLTSTAFQKALKSQL